MRPRPWPARSTSKRRRRDSTRAQHPWRSFGAFGLLGRCRECISGTARGSKRIAWDCAVRRAICRTAQSRCLRSVILRRSMRSAYGCTTDLPMRASMMCARASQALRKYRRASRCARHFEGALRPRCARRRAALIAPGSIPTLHDERGILVLPHAAVIARQREPPVTMLEAQVVTENFAAHANIGRHFHQLILHA